jgi:GntR family transcriptional regulator, rspAB operon transcriptional repressor
MSSSSLAARVYEEILKRLLTGKLVPGQIFNRRQTAAELGVSVAPVLEAMLELEAEGLIETLPRKGTRVRVLTLVDLQGQLVVREALECQAARLYCGRPVQQHMKQLIPLAEEIDASDLRSPEHLKDEIFFHHYLVSLAATPALTEAYERVMKLGLLYLIQVFHPDPRSAPKASHVEFVNALTSQDPDAAEAAVRAHVQSGKEALFEQWVASRSTASPNVPSWLKR